MPFLPDDAMPAPDMPFAPMPIELDCLQTDELEILAMSNVLSCCALCRMPVLLSLKDSLPNTPRPLSVTLVFALFLTVTDIAVLLPETVILAEVIVMFSVPF